MEEFTNRELGLLLKSLHKKTDDNHRTNQEAHLAIVTHAKETNGNVSKNTAFKNKAYGGFAVLGFLGVSILIKLFI